MDFQEFLYGESMSSFEAFGILMGIAFIIGIIYLVLFFIVSLLYELLKKIFYTSPKPLENKYIPITKEEE